MRSRQRGAALILFATVLVLGFAWYAVGALGKAPVASAERDVMTGLALQKAKQALLAYLAAEAARSDNDRPGRLPCPESLNAIGTANEGQASGNCGNGEAIGRLPWGTLGIDQLRDGDGEPLWYAISPGFRTSAINFGTPGQLAFDGAANSAVAVIIAPGRPLKTTVDPSALPAWCPAKVDQYAATRNTAPLAAANFLECGNATSAYRNPGTSQWTNDRALAITATEWQDAIAPGVADRLQRQVAPAMQDYYDNTSFTSWRQRFLPNAAPFDPANSLLCGAADVFAGTPPTASVASGNCGTNWDSASVSGLGALLSFGGCAPWPDFVSPTELHCEFLVVLGVTNPRITISAPRAGYAFRALDTSAIRVEVNGPVPALLGGGVSGTTVNWAGSIAPVDGRGTLSFDVVLSALPIGLLDSVRIRIPYLTDALAADTRTAWYVSNGWDRFTHYSVSQAASHDPSGTVCTPGGTITNCLSVSGLPASTPSSDKRLVLVLMGRALAGQTQPSTAAADYLEYDNAGGATYEARAQGADFNDRVAACPFKYTNESGADVLICS